MVIADHIPRRHMVTVDTIGTKRNICTAIGTGAEIAKTSAKMVSVSRRMVPILQMAGGSCTWQSAAGLTLPKAQAEYNGACEEYSAATLSHNPRKIQQATEGIAVARMGLTNQYLYGTVGAPNDFLRSSHIDESRRSRPLWIHTCSCGWRCRIRWRCARRCLCCKGGSGDRKVSLQP